MRVALATAEDARDAAQDALNALQATVKEKDEAATAHHLGDDVYEAIGAVSAPNVVAIFEAGIAGRRPYLTAVLAADYIRHSQMVIPGIAEGMAELAAWEAPFDQTDARAMSRMADAPISSTQRRYGAMLLLPCAPIQMRRFRMVRHNPLAPSFAGSGGADTPVR